MNGMIWSMVEKLSYHLRLLINLPGLTLFIRCSLNLQTQRHPEQLIVVCHLSTFFLFIQTNAIIVLFEGVLEFVADEGKVYIPYWMMQNLAIDQGGLLMVESASLPVATFAKFQPHSVDFLDLTNPKAVLESKLRNFACLSTGDVVAIDYNNKVSLKFYLIYAC